MAWGVRCFVAKDADLASESAVEVFGFPARCSSCDALKNYVSRMDTRASTTFFTFCFHV